MDCTPGEESDQRGQPSILIIVFAVRLHDVSKDSDQAVQPPSLIIVFVVRLYVYTVAKDLSRLHDVSKDSDQIGWMPRARGYKTFFMLNSAGHEILSAHKYENINKNLHFSGSDKPRMLFFVLINVEMPTLVGILTLMSRKFSYSAELSMLFFFITSGPG